MAGTHGRFSLDMFCGGCVVVEHSLEFRRTRDRTVAAAEFESGNSLRVSNLFCFDEEISETRPELCHGRWLGSDNFHVEFYRERRSGLLLAHTVGILARLESALVSLRTRGQSRGDHLDFSPEGARYHSRGQRPRLPKIRNHFDPEGVA